MKRYDPRHAVIRAVRSLPLWAKIVTPAVTALALAGGGAVLAAGAGATVSPTTTYTSDGVAGWYVAPNANRLGNGDHITGVRSTFSLGPAAENNQIDLGVELCRYQGLTTPGAAAVVYAQWDSIHGVFDIYAWHGLTSNCLEAQGGAPSGSEVLIDTIAPGDTVQLEITVSAHHVITYTDSDQTTLTGGRTTFGGFTFGFDRAGVGANGQQGLLTTPADNQVADFALTGVRDAPGWALINRKNLTRLVANEVVDTTSGTSAGGVLVTPGSLAADGFPLFMGQLSAS